ncbi:unnamed protein product [Linum tenue]|uniref:5'-3' DNA helicase ZGRF1-like N-terminal domain-containing protein n=1 Tax=Linum tenue TaxID=586396 RepID=A0AAV0M603_9ROSI|nr:unnamed protein product [Linum tenue]
MEASERKKNRWSVTYTKHVKQKRKVYQDGFLDHFIITNKVMLFDEFEKLLECRVLKDEEVVSSGESLTFNSYLVDVGDPEGHRMPVPERDKKMPQRGPSVATRQKFRSPSINYGRENIVEKNKILRNDLSPSQKIIREFKKNELQKYEAPKSGKDTDKLGAAEWQVLYTTQVTKKAKTYHDGFLRVANCGSFQKQVMLYDVSMNLLTSRFLKKDEAVASGRSISMDGHLIEIGEAEDDRSHSVDIHDGQGDGSVNGKIKVMPGRQSCSKSSPIVIEDVEASDARKSEQASAGGNITTSTITEWQVMYTSQMTQKAKKYHDGFLKLENHGTRGRQVKLYDVSWNILISRQVKKDERICSGESIAFGGYLVDIGELEGDNQVLPSLNKENCPKEFRKPDRLNHASLGSWKSTLKEELHVNDLPRQFCSRPKLERTKFAEIVPAKQPLRDAWQILSVLKKPPQKSADAECINHSQIGRASSIEVLQASAGDSVLFPVLGTSENMASKDLNMRNHFDVREENTSRYSRIPGGAEAVHSSQHNLDNMETSTKSRGEGLGFTYYKFCNNLHQRWPKEWKQ